MGLSTAYATGATGDGITVAVVDTGINASHPELIGRVNIGASTDIAGSRGFNDTDGHGTLVAGVIAANKDDIDIHGVAFESTILALRTDSPGSCGAAAGGEDNCSFTDPNIASAIDYAISQNVDIINLSLGGPIDASQIGENAIRRAANAGILTVISAGNDGAASPDDPAYIAGEVNSRGLVVAVGSLDENGDISDFSNRAGPDPNLQQFYLLAPGEELITPGLGNSLFRVAGTSFAAPFVAGSLALVLDAFPNLTPAQALDLLLTTADDLGAPGPDAIYGAGRINLEQAFSPAGTTSISINRVPTSVSATLVPASGPFGDWLTNSSGFTDLVFQDSYDRGFKFNDAVAIGSSARVIGLRTLGEGLYSQSASMSAGPVSFTWNKPHRDNFFSLVPYELDPQATFQFDAHFTDYGVSLGQGQNAPKPMRPQFNLIRPDQANLAGPASDDITALTDAPQERASSLWTSAYHRLGQFKLDFTAVESDRFDALELGASFEQPRYTLRVAAGSETVLDSGDNFSLLGRFGYDDAFSSTFVALESNALLPFGWTASGFVEAGRMSFDGVQAGFDLAQSPLTSSWGASFARSFKNVGDIRVNAGQPRRAETGALAFEGPVGVNAAGGIEYALVESTLTPSGREIDFELQFGRQLGPNRRIGASAAYILSPAHVATADNQAALWLSYQSNW